jgi:hypothetical protein
MLSTRILFVLTFCAFWHEVHKMEVYTYMIRLYYLKSLGEPLEGFEVLMQFDIGSRYKSTAI